MFVVTAIKLNNLKIFIFFFLYDGLKTYTLHATCCKFFNSGLWKFVCAGLKFAENYAKFYFFLKHLLNSYTVNKVVMFCLLP